MVVPRWGRNEYRGFSNGKLLNLVIFQAKDWQSLHLEGWDVSGS